MAVIPVTEDVGDSEQLNRIEEKLDRVLSLLQQADPLACPKCGATDNLVSVKTTTTAPWQTPMMCSACGKNFDGVAA